MKGQWVFLYLFKTVGELFKCPSTLNGWFVFPCSV